MPAPTASLVFQWKPNVTQSNFNCGGNGDTVAGEEVHVVLYVVYDQDSGVTHNYTKWQEVAGHSNQYAERLNIAGAPPDPNNPCAPTPGPNQLVVAFDWWDVYPTRFHNGDYEVRASYSYTPAGGSTVTPPDVVINVTFNDALLSIVTPPSPPYFLWNPADPTNSKVTVSFSVSDAQTFPGMTAVLKVYPLERAAGTPPFHTQTMSVNVPTTIPIDFTWDGKDEAGNVMPKGIYAYDLRIDDMAGMGSDVDDKVSAFLSLAEPIDPETGLPVSDATYIGYDEAAGTDDFEVSYVLKDTDGVAASSGKIELYDPDLLMVFSHLLAANDLTASAQGIQHTAALKVPAAVMEKEGDYPFVISAVDNHSNKEKGHRLKPALQVSQKAPRLDFNVSTDPLGSSQQGHPGFKVGVQDNTKFYVVIKATLDFKTGKTPPTSVRFLLKRTSTGVKAPKTGYLIENPNDPEGPQVLPGGMTTWTYRTYKLPSEMGVKDWVVTQQKGRWDIKVDTPLKSNTVQFKIDKRAQIVQVANTWVNAPEQVVRDAQVEFCQRLTAWIYRHVGLPLLGRPPEALGDQYNQVKNHPDSGNGCLLFYNLANRTPWDPAHVGIKDGDNVIDVNCALHPGADIRKHGINAAVTAGHYDSDIRSFTMKELLDLDGE